jgi:dCTP deaminase
MLSFNQLVNLIDDGVITHSKVEHVNSASIDIQLGKNILIERTDPSLFQKDQNLKRVSLRKREKLHMIEWDLQHDGPYILYPNEFILAHSIEVFNLPNNISAEYKLKSSMARIGLDHLNAGFCDAGWHGSVLTLELKNVSRHHEIVLEYGDLIGQMVFFLHEEVPLHASYATRGRYNKDKTVSGAKTKSKAILFGDSQEETYQEEFNKTHIEPEEVENIPRKIIEISGGEEDA